MLDMALHCAATLVLVPAGTAPDAASVAGVVVAPPLEAGADVVDELQALADLHRGERVVVPMAPGQVDAVLEHLGRAHRPAGDVVLLDIGDDGWALVPSPT
ncbi:MAG: hypothetical protein ACJ715_08875 [Ornithinibacter sp.]